MKDEFYLMQSGARITKKAHAGHGQESKREITAEQTLAAMIVR